jgi:prepilin-type N-terminal cleavage/methylation domain-containing protein
MNDLNRIPTNRSPVIKFKGADSGFTFVELLVTIAIVVGLSALAIPSIRALVEDSSGNRAVSQVVDDLHLARSLAVRYHRRAIVDFDVPSNQYTLTWNQNANSRVVDISSYRNGVRFMDDPPAPSPS